MSLAPAARATVLHVPTDYPTIQSAVDAASSGDEIQIAAGVYMEQVVINGTDLTLTGAPGAIIKAWPGMSVSATGNKQFNLLEIEQADVVVRGLEFEGEDLAQIYPQPSAFDAVLFLSASGRVENCVVNGFNGTNSFSQGNGVLSINPVALGTDIVHVQVLNNRFSDNGAAIWLGGDTDKNPDLLRTTFVIEGNQVNGLGPTSVDAELGILIDAGASGVVKGNQIVGHYYTGPTPTSSGAYWALGIVAYSTSFYKSGSVQAVRYERNRLLNNQEALGLDRANNSQIIDNFIQGPDGGLPSDGLFISGTNLLVTINQFTNLTRGVVFIGNDALSGTTYGIASNSTLVANQFCGVSTQVVAEPPVTGITNIGSQGCPLAPPNYGNLACLPSSGLAGTAVTLTGTNLSGTTMVLFNDVSATFTNGVGPDADRLITAIVPPHATTGPITVLTPQGNITSLTPFTVPVLMAMTLPSPGQVQLSWTADASDMLLETTSDLAAPNWQTVSTSPSVGTAQVTWTGSQGDGAQFFRLRQP